MYNGLTVLLLGVNVIMVWLLMVMVNATVKEKIWSGIKTDGDAKRVWKENVLAGGILMLMAVLMCLMRTAG